MQESQDAFTAGILSPMGGDSQVHFAPISNFSQYGAAYKRQKVASKVNYLSMFEE